MKQFLANKSSPKYMEKITVEQIRSSFIDYFKKHDHTHVPSSSLVPHNDPTLMFVNSGMVQFKDVFTGAEKRPYSRAVSAQKSVRAGGKHNDLDNVGYTARHHTFFEMLGNFSFGDYFKERAIYYAFDLLTKEFGLPKEKLYITVYHNDDEAASLWKKISGFSDDRIIRIATNDNFWSMGDSGPCGPCSEVFYDHGDKIWGGLPGSPEADGDRYIEIWNLVFMQYEQIDASTRIELPKKSVDTGMGLERVAAVIQGVHDNYDIDLFKEIIGFTESILKVAAKGDNLSCYRIIADHLRSSCFLIADGVMPSNEGRGYVLRRIMRRAMNHAHQLGAREPLIYKLLPKLVDLSGHAYPELKRAEDFISSILRQEEERFRVTLDRGLKLLSDESAVIKNNILSGEVAFKLYDTYGFPLDLTEDILKKKKIEVDIDGFNNCMQEQKERARKSWAGSGESKADTIWFDLLSEFGATEFLGYLLDATEAKVTALIQNGKRVKQISGKEEKFTLIANQTPFYAESGGQMGDIGTIESSHCKIKVLDTIKYLGKIHAHICELQDGIISEDDSAKFIMDTSHRNNLRKHHSATHILHSVMRNVLGRHITQKGSLVAKDRLRFDVSHPKAITKAELNLIEDKVNQIIADNSRVITELMSTDKAIESGAMALFGEKYDSEVRVVSMGHDKDETNPYSFELCGGTHVARTGDIGAFKIVSEGALAAGIRRIEAVCGEYAFKLIRENEDLLENVIDTLKASKPELVKKVETLVNSKKELEKELEKYQLEKISLSASQLEEKAEKIHNIRLIYQKMEQVDPRIMRMAAENLVKNHPDLVAVYLAVIDSKLSLIVAVSAAISGKYNAGLIVKEIAPIIGGMGGGQATLAQAGGNDSSRISLIPSMVKDLLIKL